MMPAPHDTAPEVRRPLTRSQLLMWTGQQLHPRAPLYNMVLTFAIDGPLNVDAFESAVQAVVDRSDALRTVIAMRGNEPEQVVRSAVPCRLERLEMPESEVSDWVRGRAARPFDLSTSLFDTALIRVNPNRHVWYLNQHHLITDGWSVALVYRYVSDFYERALAGTLDEVPALPAYADYAAFETAFRESAAYKTAAAFWKERQAQTVSPVRLYGVSSSGTSTQTTRYTRALGAERSRRLKEIALNPDARSLTQHLSQFNVFVAALLAYLYRVSGQRDLSIGSPSHNRPTAAFKETVGLFIEVFPLRVRLDEDETFLSLFRKVRAEANLFLRNAQPGTSTAAANRGFNVLLNYITASFPPFAGLATTSDWVHAGHGDDRHQLRLQVHDFDGDGEFLLHFDFNDAAFPRERSEAAMGHFLRLLDAMLDDPSAAIRDIELPTDAERETLTARFARPSASYRTVETVLDRIQEWVERTPDAVAVAEGARTLTYAQLDAASNRLAGRLAAEGAGSGRCVGLLMERSIDVLSAILGIVKSGAAYVPLDPAHPEPRIAMMLEEAGVEVAVVQPGLERLLPDSVRVLHVGDAGDGATSAPHRPAGSDLAYVLYTSGSTGRPKGVPITHESLAHYVCWASQQYLGDQSGDFPLFTPLTFDLTVTSIFVPLITGGRVMVYPDAGNPAATVLQVFDDDAVDVVKLTPSHLRLLLDRDLSAIRVRALILGGEDLKTDLSRRTVEASGGRITIYNEYGPTEATVGCMIHRFDPATDRDVSVPIGRPAVSARIYVLDDGLRLLPPGVTGEIYVGGPGLAQGYLNRPDLTSERFVPAPHLGEARLYRTGDLGRWTWDGTLEYLGRIDHQVKIRGVRIELGEIEAALVAHPAIRDAVVDVVEAGRPNETVLHCVRCGLPSNYPGATFSDEGLCHLCIGFPTYEARARGYFRGMDELRAIFDEARRRRTGDYDCLMLLSGGKDSTYALYQLVGMGLKVLAFTLDNGYISEGAKANIRRVTQGLGVDHIFGQTPAMNVIFADSLRRHSNVCNGCFKTIYTLGIQLALEKGITHIVTGLSRGQFFETRLTEELFQDADGDADRIDLTILEARKAYHRADDAVSRLLDVSALQRDELFEQIQFVDFYRYCDVDLDEMLSFLDKHAPWVRPADTGRSTNCLINDAGIYVHKLERGYHNYAFPYSWDVRMGHKTRDEALTELYDEIDEASVRRMLDEVGYTPQVRVEDDHRLVAYYVSDEPVSAATLRSHLALVLPDAMIPSHFVALDRLPLNDNGKVDRAALPRPDPRRPSLETTFVAPRTPVEERIASLWEHVLQVDRVGVTDEFVALGGNSLLAIQIIARVNRDFGIDLAIHEAFTSSTVGELAALVERTLLEEIEAMPEEEARRLAGETMPQGPAA